MQQFNLNISYKSDATSDQDFGIDLKMERCNDFRDFLMMMMRHSLLSAALSCFF